jgi:hypothetical protein
VKRIVFELAVSINTKEQSLRKYKLWELIISFLSPYFLLPFSALKAEKPEEFSIYWSSGRNHFVPSSFAGICRSSCSWEDEACSNFFFPPFPHFNDVRERIAASPHPRLPLR